MSLVIRRHRRLSGRAAREAALEMLAAVELPEPRALIASYPHELSGGMQQRVMIAMALSSGAELIIADEPTTALDVTIQAQILALLTSLQRKHGLTVLLITHNLGLVAESCDRVGVLYAGTLVELGPTQAVLDARQHPYTEALLAAIPGPASRRQALPAIAGTVPNGLQAQQGCPFAPRCPRVMDICHQDRPGLVETRPAHAVACYLHHDQRMIGGALEPAAA
jgi:oligopeptide/dipeptide ABC transporter ATP-binding protein